MGKIGEALGSAALDGLTGGVGGLVSGAVGGIGSLLGLGSRKEKKAREAEEREHQRQLEYMALQAKYNKEQAELEALGFVDQYGRDLLDKQHQEQMDDIDEREKAELAALGLIDNTESQNLAESMTKKQREINTEISSRKRAILQAELAELASENQKISIFLLRGILYLSFPI